MFYLFFVVVTESVRAQISTATAKTKSIEDALQYELASDWSSATFDG